MLTGGSVVNELDDGGHNVVHVHGAAEFIVEETENRYITHFTLGRCDKLF
jgi:hypothetical protein